MKSRVAEPWGATGRLMGMKPRRARIERYATLAVLVIVLSGGCASRTPTASVPGPVPSSAIVYVEDHCSMTASNGLTPIGASRQTAAPTMNPGSGGVFPAGFVPVEAISCGTLEENVAGDGVWRVATQTKAVGSLADLLTAYRTPAPSTTGGACTLDLDMDPVIALVDAAGTAIWPAPPRDRQCKHVSTKVTAAIGALRWAVTASQRTVHDSTQGGCQSGYKYMVSPLSTNTTPATKGPYFATTPQRLTLCVYKITSGGPVPEGAFVQEIELNGTALVKAVAVLDSASPAMTCTKQPTRFAVLIGNANAGAGAEGDQDGYVELDGCMRVGMADTGGPGNFGGLRQLDPAGIATLTTPSP